MQNDSQTTPETAKLKRKEYEKELHKLQIELCKLQEWVRTQGLRIIVIFEGRDGAGKGGTAGKATRKGRETAPNTSRRLPRATTRRRVCRTPT